MHSPDLIECLEFGNLMGTLHAPDFSLRLSPWVARLGSPAVIPIARLRAEG